MSKKIVLAILCFCCSLAWGQMGNVYQASNSDATVNNIPNCVVGQNNCWHLGNVVLSTLSSGVDGYTGGLDSAGNAYFYNNYPTNNWTLNSAMGSGIDYLAIGSSSNIYAAFVESAACYGFPHRRIKHWSGTAWVPVQRGCLDTSAQLSVAADGTLAFVWPSLGLYYTTDGAHNWINYNFWGDLAQAIAVNSDHFIILKADGSVFSFEVSTGTTTALLNSCCATQISVDANSVLYTLGSDGYVSRYNGSGLDKLAGAGFTSIANGGPMNIWAVGPTQSGSNVWRFQIRP